MTSGPNWPRPFTCSGTPIAWRSSLPAWISRFNRRLDAAVWNVGDMARQLALSSSLVSHHLRLLRAARVLKRERRGKQAYYNLDDAHVREMLTNMI